MILHIAARGARGLVVGAMLLLHRWGMAHATACSSASIPEGAILAEAVTVEALPLIVEGNCLGLGSEARSVLSWARAHESPVTLVASQRILRDGAGGQLQLSSTIVTALERLNQWYGLMPATRSHPVTHGELRDAALSPPAVARISRLFEESIQQAVMIGGSWLVPETGGEASMDDELRLFAAPDATWSTVRELAQRIRDADGIASLYADRGWEMALLDPHDILKTSVARLRLGLAGGAENVMQSATAVVRNASEAYSLSPEAQLSLIVGTDWGGRYVGRWHTHPPRRKASAWAGGDVPSFEDMQNAVEGGQFLTISFEIDGFTLYDAAPLGDKGRADLGLLKAIRYRSPAWHAHFKALFGSLDGGQIPQP